MEGNALAILQEKIQSRLVSVPLPLRPAGAWERISSRQCVTEEDVGMQLIQACAVVLSSPMSSQVPPCTGVRLDWLLTNM